MSVVPSLCDRFQGCLFGLAPVDAIGAPYKGLSGDMISRMAPEFSLVETRRRSSSTVPMSRSYGCIGTNDGTGRIGREHLGACNLVLPPILSCDASVLTPHREGARCTVGVSEMQPWRLLLPRLSSVPEELDRNLFEAILTLERKRSQQAVASGEESNWSVDQERAMFSLHFDNREILARPQIIGTFDGETFMWAWHNPSIAQELQQNAKTVRDFGQKRGWSVFTQPTFPATQRDGYAMTALAAQLTGAECAYAGSSGGTTVYFTLHDLRVSDDRISEASIQDTEPSIMQLVDSMISARLAKVQLSLPELRQVESLCRRGHEQLEAGHYTAALTTLDQAWLQLGKHAADQEPAGWVQLTKGNVLVLAGQYQEGLRALIAADRLHTCPDQVLLYRLLGQCWLALGDRGQAIDMFIRSYVAGGFQSFDEPRQNGGELLHAALRDCWEKAERRISEDVALMSGANFQFNLAAATVSCLITDLHEFETNAHEIDKLAASERTDAHILCDADWEARDDINTRWCWIMATWCTPGRSSKCGGWGSPPAHDPGTERILSVVDRHDGTIVVETIGVACGGKGRWRYELTKHDQRLLVRQVFSVWDDETYPSL